MMSESRDKIRNRIGRSLCLSLQRIADGRWSQCTEDEQSALKNSAELIYVQGIRAAIEAISQGREMIPFDEGVCINKIAMWAKRSGFDLGDTP